MAEYITSTGKKLNLYLWRDFLNGRSFRDFVVVREEITSTTEYDEFEGEGSKYKVYEDAIGRYFVYEGESIYFKDYSCMSLNELIDKIKEGIAKDDFWLVTHDDMILTFMRYWDSIGIERPLYTYSETEDRYTTILTRPVENDRDSRYTCSYKMTFEAVNEDVRRKTVSNRDYSSTIFDNIKNGKYSLVNLESDNF